MLSGQTPEAFWNSVRHAEPISVGLNCALGAKEMRAHIAELVAGRRHAGLRLSERRPAERVRPLRREPGRHGAACSANSPRPGSSTSSAAAAARRRRTSAPSRRRCAAKRRAPCPRSQPLLRLSGLEPFTLTPEIPFVNVGERTNVTGSAKFRKLITAGDYTAALAVAREQVENGAQIIDVNMDEGLLDSEQAMMTFLNLIAAEPDIARVPVMVDSSKFAVIEAGLKCVQGKPVVNSISLKEGEAAFIEHAQIVRRYGAAVVVMAFDEQGQADTHRAQGRDLRARLRHSGQQGRLPARGHHLRSEHLRGRDRHRGAQRLRRRLHRGGALDPRRTCRVRTSPAACRTCRSRSAATSRCARRCTRCSSITPSRPAWTWASSMPGRSRSTTISSRSCARPARTSCSTGGPTRPSGCWRSPQRFHGAGKEQGAGRSRLARMAGGEAAVACAGARHHRFHRRRTPRRRGLPPTRPLDGDRRPADGRHERGRRPVRLGQDVPAAGGEVRARDEAGGRLPDAVHGGGEGRARRHRPKLGRQGRAWRP